MKSRTCRGLSPFRACTGFFPDGYGHFDLPVNFVSEFLNAEIARSEIAVELSAPVEDKANHALVSEGSLLTPLKVYQLPHV